MVRDARRENRVGMHVDSSESRRCDATGSRRRTRADGRVQDGGSVSRHGAFDEMAGKKIVLISSVMGRRKREVATSRTYEDCVR